MQNNDQGVNTFISTQSLHTSPCINTLQEAHESRTKSNHQHVAAYCI